MSTFKEIRGTLIKSVSSDPANPELGEIWYNNTIGSLKGYVTVADAWASGGALNTARGQLFGSGTQTAAIAAGGLAPSVSPSTANLSEEYNGTSWTTGGAYPVAIANHGGTGSA